VPDDQTPRSATCKPEPPAVSTSLFRRQAIEHMKAQHYGTILLTRPFNHLVLTVVFVLIAGAIMVFLGRFETTRKTHCQGVLVPAAGMIRITPPQVGVITESHVKEGQLVRAGDVLFTLSSERSIANGAATQGTISMLLARRRDSFHVELRQSRQQAEQRIAAAGERVDAATADIKRTQEQIALQQQRLALAEQSLKRYTDLQATNFISAAQRQEKLGEVIDQRQRLAELERTRATARRELMSATADLHDLRIQAERDNSAIERNLATVEQELAENEARREILIRAPRDGTLAAINAYPGQSISGADTLAILLPANTQLEAELYAPSDAIGFIKPGLSVLLSYDAYPFQKFGHHRGIVIEVANAPLRPQELGMGTSANASAPLYRIRIRLDAQTVQAYGRHMPLKSGMLVQASVMLERRKLYEWIVEPIFSISGRL
jgi:membrane fusion protein